jgi:C4-dicarboxylate transporter DctM subunit
MSSELLAAIGIVILIVLILLRLWIAAAMSIVGFVGFGLVMGWKPALGVLAQIPFSTVNYYPLTTIPLFVFMGVILFNTGIGKDLYDFAYAWVGRFRGGLAMATTVACAVFGAITGISAPALVTMGKVAIPEMRKRGYGESFSAGCVACAGTLAILIPPSIPMIIYGILTQKSIGQLFMAGIMPGIMLMGLYIVLIAVWTRIRPSVAPAGDKSTMKVKMVTLWHVWPAILLVLLVLGGIYGGVFTPTEAGAIGAFGACLITLAMRRLNFKMFVASLLEAAKMTAFILILIVGAYVLMKFLAVSGLTNLLETEVGGMDVPHWVVMLVLIVIYIVLGMVLDVTSAVIMTIPVVFPIVTAMGYDPIWFGVVIILLIQMGLVTPPVGLDVFILGGAINVPLFTIFKGVAPYVVVDLVCIVILMIFPSIATWLPYTM